MEEYFLRILFIYATSSILAAFFIATVIQGILVHLNGDTVWATIHYFISIVSLILAFHIYKMDKAAE